LKDIQAIQETTTKACKRLWDNSNDLIEEFEMKEMPPIDEATPSKVRIFEVEEYREISQVNIENLTEVNKEVLEEYLLKPVRLITMT
jgi:hypothetical protein